MSQYEMPQLIKMWAQEMLTSEQAIGQLLLRVQALEERVKRVEQRVRPRGRPGPATEPGETDGD
jgi:hypothetical protein